MSSQVLNAALVKKMFIAGAKNLESKKEWINELNVFPVPDGDTGTNMCMTIMSAANEVAALENPTMKELAKAISSGSLRGARGNSGVILSQLFRGFTNVIKLHEEIDKAILTEAIVKAVETAYKAVMKPKEGTILTVAKGASDKAVDMADTDCTMEEFIECILAEADAVLQITPEMLPVLKQAGVVDSGGQGLVEVLRGARDAYLGKEVDYSMEVKPASSGVVKISEETNAEIKFGYCTEFIVVLDKPIDENEEFKFKGFLEGIGDSIVVVADDEIIKIHVHTNDPGLALQKGLSYGSLSRIKIDNMREEHQEKLIKDAEKLAAEQAAAKPVMEHKEVGFIAVSIGAGVDEVFRGLGADYIIAGGQTMNPSTEDMLNAIDAVNADTIFIFPNNSNIILAANQAASIVEDKRIVVVPTKTIPQGVTALINYVPEQTVEENEESMIEVIGTVKTGQITYAVRDTSLDGKEIREGDYMGVGDKTILANGKDMDAVIDEMVSDMVAEESSFICVYYGEGIEEDQAQAVCDRLADNFPQCEVELQFGGQPVYYYIISVE